MHLRALGLAAAIGLSTVSFATVAHAGDRTMTNSKGQTIVIRCRNSGCFVNGRRVGEGGRSNFNKHVRRYRKRGYK
ncbi:MAG: hypothetical protein AAGF32_06760 [Pseudomonadota bacterium]